MATNTIDIMVKGGAATAAPPLGPALGPAGVNIGAVVAEINKKTFAMKGMDVPVKVKIDTDTKEFEIEIGTPPASALIKKELHMARGSGKPNTEKSADMPIEIAIKIAKIKQDNLLANSLKAAVKEIIGTGNSLGVLVDGKEPKVVLKEIDEGKYNAKINAESHEEINSEKLKAKTQEFQAGLSVKKAAADEDTKVKQEDKNEASK